MGIRGRKPPKKPVPSQDLKELVRLVRPIAHLQVQFMKKGFSAEEIAQTFSEVYIHALDREMEAQELVVYSQSYPGQPALTSSQAVEKYFINLANALLQVVIEFSQRDDDLPHTE